MNSDQSIEKSVFRKADELVHRKIAGETILVPIRGRLVDMQRIFSLNPVAEYIWEQLDGNKNVTDILNGIMAAFDVEKEQAEADMHEFIAELVNADLIVEEK